VQPLQNFVYAAFLALLLGSLALSPSRHVDAAGDGRIAPSAMEIDPLQAGEKAPAFTVRTVDNEDFHFDPDRLARPTILVTFRGGWCPYCNLHLSELRKVVPEIREKGVDILFLSGDRPELLYSSLKRETQEAIDGLGYTILSDADVNAAIALGIAFRTGEGMAESFESRGTDIAGSSIKNFGALPVPAVYVIDRDGMITYSFVEPDYKIRLSAQDLLAAASEVAD